MTKAIQVFDGTGKDPCGRMPHPQLPKFAGLEWQECPQNPDLNWCGTYFGKLVFLNKDVNGWTVVSGGIRTTVVDGTRDDAFKLLLEKLRGRR